MIAWARDWGKARGLWSCWEKILSPFQKMKQSRLSFQRWPRSIIRVRKGFESSCIRWSESMYHSCISVTWPPTSKLTSGLKTQVSSSNFTARRKHTCFRENHKYCYLSTLSTNKDVKNMERFASLPSWSSTSEEKSTVKDMTCSSWLAPHGGMFCKYSLLCSFRYRTKMLSVWLNWSSISLIGWKWFLKLSSPLRTNTTSMLWQNWRGTIDTKEDISSILSLRLNE